MIPEFDSGIFVYLNTISSIDHLLFCWYYNYMRTEHPFDMYDSIQAQPSVFKEVVNQNQEQIKELEKLLTAANKIFLVGTGTSYHAAWTSSFILKSQVKDRIILPQTAIDFALYEQAVNPEDVVVVFSHRGTKKYSLQSLEKANKRGAKAILITGKGGGQHAETDLTIETVDQEKSSAHTVSYTAAVAIMVGAVGGPVESLSAALGQCLELENIMSKEAEQSKDARKVWIVGGGPNEVIAKEIALKIKETSYMVTEGVGVEELFHGPFQSADPKDWFILLAPEGKTKGRTLELIPAIDEIGSRYLLLSSSNFKQVLDEEFSSLQCLVALQLFTYHLALAKGTNPDSFRLDDSRFARAEKYMKL